MESRTPNRLAICSLSNFAFWHNKEPYPPSFTMGLHNLYRDGRLVVAREKELLILCHYYFLLSKIKTHFNLREKVKVLNYQQLINVWIELCSWCLQGYWYFSIWWHIVKENKRQNIFFTFSLSICLLINSKWREYFS